MDKLKQISSMLQPAVYDSQTAQLRIMENLLVQVANIMGDKGAKTKRICTLHKVEDNIIKFHMSDGVRVNAADLSIDHLLKKDKNSIGLIGKTIKDKESIAFYPNARDVPEFRLGWPDCEAELIAVIKDSDNVIVGVVNIESTNKNDFKDEKYNKELKDLLGIVVPIFSIIYRTESLSKSNNIALNLINELDKIDLSVNNDVRYVFDDIYWLMKSMTNCQFGLAYMSKKESGLNKLQGVMNRMPPNSTIQNEIEIEKWDLLQQFSYSDICSKNKLEEIFGEDFMNGISCVFESENGDQRDIRVVIGYKNIREKDDSARFIIVLFFNERQPDLARINGFEKIFENVIRKELKCSESINNELVNSLYQKLLEGTSVRSMVDTACTFVHEKSFLDLCIYYSLSHWGEKENQEPYFYFGGASRSVPQEMAYVRFEKTEGILGSIFNRNTNNFYISDLFSSKTNVHKIDSYLHDFGMSEPELYGAKVYRKDHTLMGIIIIASDSSIDKKDRTEDPNVKNILLQVANHLSNIIYLRDAERHDRYLINSQKTLLSGMLSLVKNNDEEQFITEFEKLVASCLPSDTRGTFIIYERYGNEMKPYSKNRTDLPDSPPNFLVGDGLSGAVMYSKNGIFYEPNVEYNSNAKPNCKRYWDIVTGSANRMFFGIHCRIGFRDFVFLSIRAREATFNPDQGYMLIKHIMDIAKKQFEEIFDELIVNSYTDAKPRCDISVDEQLKTEVEILFKVALRDFEDDQKDETIIEYSKELLNLYSKECSTNKHTDKEGKLVALGKATHSSVEKIASAVGPYQKIGKMIAEYAEFLLRHTS